jgi:hypothetical protein
MDIDNKIIKKYSNKIKIPLSLDLVIFILTNLILRRHNHSYSKKHYTIKKNWWPSTLLNLTLLKSNHDRSGKYQNAF